MVEEGKTEILTGGGCATKNLVITECFDFPCP